ncbi:hypothetical protein OIU84_001479 [Salix udensis]|uniref:Uncharacterized protein n=1 Tax=Salix udensis TaxID=889485 RepID=A0AAD6K7J9_9ROSI|nr:hypothetical protein OIU84_001479 [Salix udensis]
MVDCSGSSAEMRLRMCQSKIRIVDYFVLYM